MAREMISRRSLSRRSLRVGLRKSQAEAKSAGTEAAKIAKDPRVHMGAASVAGRKRSMAAKATQGLIVGNEDRVEVDPEHGLAAVFDGHGGSLCADFLARHSLARLREALASRGLLAVLRRKSRDPLFSDGDNESALAEEEELEDDDFEEEDEEQAGEDGEGDEQIQIQDAAEASMDEALEGVHDALKETFAALEEEFHEIWQRTGDTSGACAMLCVILGKMIVVANCGDCRAVYRNASLRSHRILRRRSRPTIQVTEDHRITASLAERQRVLDAGGVIEHGRICTLCPSRTFGDWDIKTRVGPDVVIAEPQIVLIPVTRPMVLVLATDGVWDAMANKRALDTVIKQLKSRPGDYNAAAGVLAKTATTGTSDDASCIVLHIEP